MYSRDESKEEVLRSSRTLPFVALILLAALPATAAEERALAGLADEAVKWLEAWKVPGMAIAVVKDGEVVVAEGFGLRDVEQALPVTPSTVFPIGSSTKAFTALVLGTLVDDGKLAWDEPVRTYVPELRMHDEYVTAHLTARDLVTHRSGLPRHDLAWYGSAASREELFRRLRHLPPNTGFRSSFHYQNLMYLTAGIVAERVTGASWEDLVRTRIFAPLGMTASGLSVRDLEQHPDAARGYGSEGEGKSETIKRLPYRNIDAIGPAGSINSSIEDMTKWLRLQLEGGKSGDRQVVSAATLAELHAPVVVVTGAATRSR